LGVLAGVQQSDRQPLGVSRFAGAMSFLSAKVNSRSSTADNMSRLQFDSQSYDDSLKVNPIC